MVDHSELRKENWTPREKHGQDNWLEHGVRLTYTIIDTPQPMLKGEWPGAPTNLEELNQDMLNSLVRIWEIMQPWGIPNDSTKSLPDSYFTERLDMLTPEEKQLYIRYLARAYIDFRVPQPTSHQHFLQRVLDVALDKEQREMLEAGIGALGLIMRQQLRNREYFSPELAILAIKQTQENMCQRIEQAAKKY